MSLDEDNLKSLIQTLQLALQAGYSSSSSPIEFLLEAGIDIALQLKSLYLIGTKSAKANPELRFDENQADALANPKSFKVQKEPKVYWDPQISKFFGILASFLVKIKARNPDSLNFMFKEMERTFDKPPSKMEQHQEDNQQTHQIRLNAELGYRRRQKKKRSISKHNH